jgi:hypothetical protein
MLVGVMLPADAEATRNMAYVFAEEFARMGQTGGQLGLLNSPTAAHTALINAG